MLDIGDLSGSFFSCRGIQVDILMLGSSGWAHVWRVLVDPEFFCGRIWFNDVGDNRCRGGVLRTQSAVFPVSLLPASSCQGEDPASYSGDHAQIVSDRECK